MLKFAIADTCFLIDWSLWSKRNLLFKVFRVVFVPETVLNEVKSERTLEWLTNKLMAGTLALFTETPDVVEEARRLVELTRSVPNLRGVDLPEAICLIVGKRRKYVVLTENRGALMYVDFFNEQKNIIVWRSLEVIKEILKRKLLSDDPLTVFRSYEEETKHRFPESDLRRAIHELRGKN